MDLVAQAVPCGGLVAGVETGVAERSCRRGDGVQQQTVLQEMDLEAQAMTTGGECGNRGGGEQRPHMPRGPAADSATCSTTEDQQPFLRRFPISAFGVCLGISNQAVLWNTLSKFPPTKCAYLFEIINLIVWCIAITVTVAMAFLYILKFIFQCGAIKREFNDSIKVNYFFAPWVTLLLLGISLPKYACFKIHTIFWYLVMTMIFGLELKIYGQWMIRGKRSLSTVATPSNHMAIVGNFIGAVLGSSMGLRELPIFFFAVGLAHYLVLFVTLYQRLTTSHQVPENVRPTYFTFVSVPSVASIAWAHINGHFDYGARMAYFFALYLYFSLVVRINFFMSFKFSLTWWAYTFPMTAVAIASIKYYTEVTNAFTQIFAIVLSGISILTVIAICFATVLSNHQDLFPNEKNDAGTTTDSSH